MAELRPATERGPDDGLRLRLDVALPRRVSVGAGTAIFVCGWCFHPAAEVRALHFLLEEQRRPTMAHGMPRLDPLAELHPDRDRPALARLADDPQSAEDPQLRSYRSGFWGLVPITAADAAGRDRIELGLEAQLGDGRVARATLGVIDLAQPEARPPALASAPAGDGPLVAICMATHNPPADLLAAQLESIRRQTHRRWVCVISDDCSAPASYAALERAVAGDPRFVVSRARERLGFYRNFERALGLAPPQAEFVALCDQDDRWYEDKLAVLLGAVEAADLVYSDARVVDRDGRTLSDTYWSRRQPNHTDMLSLLVANSVSGSATLLRRALLDDALPFPPHQFAHYHDHWLALVALAAGRIAFVDRPLYDYVQHGGAALGHAAANRMPSLRERIRRRDRREQVRMWRMHYFVDACRLLQCIAILRLRLGDRILPERRRALDGFAGAERSALPLVRLGYRGLRELAGRGQTLGAEWMLFRAFTWRRLLAATARDRPQARLRLDAVPPSDLAPAAVPAAAAVATPAVRSVAAKIAPLELAVTPVAPRRVNLLIPTIDLQHFFGGYIAKFNLAHRLARAGLRVRIVTVDPTSRPPGSWRHQVEAYAGLRGALDAVEVAFGREQAPLEVNPADRFIATTWWTAHIASEAVRSLDAARFLYLIQEYEPFTFPMGSYAALAEQSYAAPHHALFSSELLREFFRRRRIGVFAAGDGEGDAASLSFQNAITDVRAPDPGQLSSRGSRRLLFYARPEPHAARNLFELGVLALSRAAGEGTLAGWELNGIGSVSGGSELSLGAGAVLKLLPRFGQDAYADLLRAHDVGLALMYTPHPSLVPIEMAAAGMLTVTNRYENKTPQALAAISSNLLAPPATVEGVAGALAQATAGVADVDQRVRGSAVAWSRDWDRSLHDELMARVIGWLGG